MTNFKSRNEKEKIMIFNIVLFSSFICQRFNFDISKDEFSNHSYKKRRDSLEISLDRALFVAELGFPKILVPRRPQHTSNVNNERAGKSEWSKQLYSLYMTTNLEQWYILVLLF